MAHAEASITIDRPVTTVFNFVLDGMNAAHWRPSVLDVQLMPGKPLGAGAVCKQGLKGPAGVLTAIASWWKSSQSSGLSFR
jgi:hypothetical protein